MLFTGSYPYLGRSIHRLGLGVRINDAPALAARVSFSFLAEHYLKADFGADAVRPKSANTIPIVEHYVRDYLVERFGEQIAEDIRPLEIQKWLKSLHESQGLAWTTVSKIRGLMLRIYKIGVLHELVSKNPVTHVETRSKTSHRAILISPAQTLAILKSLPSPLHFTLVLTCAATALRASEILALRYLAESTSRPGQLARMALEGSIIPVVEDMFKEGPYCKCFRAG
jgi:integrase